MIQCDSSAIDKACPINVLRRTETALKNCFERRTATEEVAGMPYKIYKKKR